MRMKSDNVLARYMRWVYWEERGKSDMYFLNILGRCFFLFPTLDIMVLVGINIFILFQTWVSRISQKISDNNYGHINWYITPIIESLNRHTEKN